MLDLVALVSIIAAAVSCGAAVFAALFTRRGSDAELKTDVNELALLVERMAKAQRREKMARVRASNRETPPEQPDLPVDAPADPKSAIRRRLAAVRGK